MPQNLEAERSVLGALLLHADAVCDVGFLKAEDFYLPKHQHIYTSILATFNSRNATDPIVVEEELDRQGVLQDVGGRGQLLDLLESVVSAAGIVYHAEIVREKSVQRRLLETCLDVARRCYENQAAAKELLDEAERQIFEIARMDKSG
ncbi:MAG: DnaB-like helicase N-terminal domain-containing protein, partial [Planctomycetota bacterium]